MAYFCFVRFLLGAMKKACCGVCAMAMPRMSAVRGFSEVVSRSKQNASFLERVLMRELSFSGVSMSV